MTVTSKPNSMIDKTAEGQVAVKPRLSGEVLADAAVKSGKLGGQQAKRKNVDEDDIRNADADTGAVAGDAAELAEIQDGPILLAQAEAATATDAAATGSASSAAGAEAGAAAGSGAAAGAAAGTAAMSVSTMALIGAGVVGVAAAASGGGGAAAAAAAPVTGFTISGTIALGKITDVTGLVVEAFKADGTALTVTSSTVNAGGTFTINVSENYTGAILVRLKDTNSTTDYFDEGTGTAKDIATDLRAVVYAAGANGATVSAMLTPLTELAVRQLTGDVGSDAGTSVTTLGASVAAVTQTQVNNANNAVKTAFGLASDIVATAPVTVDNTTGTVNDYGRALAAISGAEAAQSVGTSEILNQLALAIVTPATGASNLSQSAVDLLVQGATLVQAAALATPANYATGTATTLATSLTASIGTSIGSLTLSADTGANAGDFITATAAQTISGTLAATLGTNKLWGSVDGGATWTDITASVTGTALSWAVTLSGANTIKLAQTAGTVTAFTGATADIVANTGVVVQNYTVDTTAPVAPVVAVSAADATAAEATAGAITVNAEKLSTVAVTFTGTGGSVTKTVTGNGAAQAVVLAAGDLTTLGQGAVAVSAVATDLAGNASTAGTGSFNLDTVLPVFSSAATANFAENTAAATAAYTAVAADTNTVVYSLGGTDAALFNINAASGAVTFKASPNFEAPSDAGANNVYDITVTATDAAGNASSQAVAITVTNVNEIPSLTSAATANFAENGTGTAYTVAATDPDAGTTLTYALGGTDAARFSIDAATGAVTFAPSPNFEAPLDVGGDNVYNITVTASDGTLTTSPQAVAITVTNVNEAPTLTGGATSTATLALNQAFSNNISGLFADPENGALTYSATGLPAGITLNASTGALGGTPTATGQAPVVVTATDAGGLTATHTITVNVVTAPVISSIAANVAQAKSGDALTFTATISEVVTVTGTPTLTLDVGGTAMTATYSGGTGTAALTFTATTPATVDDSTVTVTAINLNGGTVIGNVTTQPLVTATVGQVVGSFVVDNSNPVFTSATTANAAENQTAAYAAGVTDATAVTYTLGAAGDNTLFNINSSTGAVTFKNANVPNFELPADAGGNNVYDITVTATDALGHAASQNVAITVTNVNEAPTVTANPPSAQTFVVNQAIAANNDVTGLFTDVDGDTLTYSQTGLPTGVTLDSQTGLITGTPTATGTADVTFTATDAGGLNVSHTIAVSIVSAPTLASTIDNVTNFDVTSNIVLTASENVTAVAGKYIHIINDANDVTNAGFHGEATTNTQDILVTSAAVTITNNTITINPGFDLDFANNYHITVDAGAFMGVTSGVASVAVSDAAAMNFGTVNPSATATVAASQKMASGTDAMVASYGWLDAEGVGTAGNYPGGAASSPTAVNRDFGLGDTAIVLNSLATGGIQTNDCAVNVNNFASGDLIYVDNHGDNAVQRQADINAGIIVDNGAAPTLLSFAASGTATGNNGGELYVTIAGSTASFTDTAGLQLLLGGGVTPVSYQPILFG